MSCCDKNRYDAFCSDCGKRKSFDIDIKACDPSNHNFMENNFCHLCGVGRDRLIREAKAEMNEILKKARESRSHNCFPYVMFVDMVRSKRLCIPTYFYLDGNNKIKSVERILDEFPNLRSLTADDIFEDDGKLTEWLYRFNINLKDPTDVGYKYLEAMNHDVEAMDNQGVQKEDMNGEHLSHWDRLKLSNLYESISEQREDERKAKKQKVV